MQRTSKWYGLLEWHLPAACIAVILVSNLYTHHHYHRLLQDCSETQMLQELASMQIMGVLLATVAVSAMKAATRADSSSLTSIRTIPHPMLPQQAARRRQQLPLV
jgi:hypothetical protein